MKATSARSAPGRGLLVDQAHAAALQVRERGLDIVDAQGHVMHAGAALLEVFRDRGIGRRRLEEFQRRWAGRDEGGADLLRHHLFARLDVQPEHVPEERERRLQIADRDPDVIQHRFHLFLESL